MEKILEEILIAAFWGLLALGAVIIYYFVDSNGSGGEENGEL